MKTSALLALAGSCVLPFTLRALTVNPGASQAGYLNATLTLSATASNGSGGYAYAWIVLEGAPVTFGDPSASLTTYSTDTAGRRVFQVSVTDTADQTLVSATVTHYIHATFQAPVMIDFGSLDSTAATTAMRINAPAHAEGLLTSSDTAWNGTPPFRDVTPAPDMLTGIVDTQGTPVGLVMHLGSGNSLVPTYANEPTQRSGMGFGQRGSVGVFATPIMADFVNSDKNYLFVRLRGFQPGHYKVYMVSRNTFDSNASAFQNVRAGVGNATTQLVTTWTANDRVGFQNDAQRAATEWIDSVGYRADIVEVSTENPDILIVANTVLNAVQIVPLVGIGIDFSVTPASGVWRAPTTMNFDASPSFGIGTLEYTWNFGDNTPSVTTSTPITSHDYDYLGAYTVTLSIRDTRNWTLSKSASFTLLGNHRPTTNAGATQAGYPGDTLHLNGANSTDEDGDTLTFSWVQLSGSPVALDTPNAATSSYTATEPGNYIFQLTVTDNGVPAFSNSAVVTNFVYAAFKSAVMIDFGAFATFNQTDTTNSPAHADSMLNRIHDTFWNRTPPYTDNGILNDISVGLKDSRGNSVGMMLVGGRAWRSFVPDYATLKPTQRSGMRNDRAGVGVYSSTIMCDFAQGGSGSPLFFRFRGFQPGHYTVYTMARVTFDGSASASQYVRVGVGNASTQLVSGAWNNAGDFTSADKIGYADNNERGLTSWVENINYKKTIVHVTKENLEILFVGTSGVTAADSGGVLNAIQIIPAPTSFFLIR